jgi:hypothetical protein
MYGSQMLLVASGEMDGAESVNVTLGYQDTIAPHRFAVDVKKLDKRRISGNAALASFWEVVLTEAALGPLPEDYTQTFPLRADRITAHVHSVLTQTPRIDTEGR